MYILLVIIVLQLAYILFKDIMSYKEREKLQLKLISKNVTEYKNAVEDKPEDSVEEEDPYIPVEEATIEQILKANE